MIVELTREELRQIKYLLDAAEGRFPDSFYTAHEKIVAALNGEEKPRETVDNVEAFKARIDKNRQPIDYVRKALGEPFRRDV